MLYEEALASVARARVLYPETFHHLARRLTRRLARQELGTALLALGSVFMCSQILANAAACPDI